MKLPIRKKRKKNKTILEGRENEPVITRETIRDINSVVETSTSNSTKGGKAKFEKVGLVKIFHSATYSCNICDKIKRRLRLGTI